MPNTEQKELDSQAANNGKQKVRQRYLILIGSVAIVMLTLLAFFAKSDTTFFAQKPSNQQNVTKREMQFPIKILFVGDMMFDRHIRQAVQKNGPEFIFQKTEKLLAANDLVVGNLEGPITDNASVSVASKVGEPKNFIFTFDPQITQILSKENIRLVNIGNNHITNFGAKGVQSTREYLTKANINFFGDPGPEQQRFLIQNIKGYNIAFVNYNQFIDDAKEKALADIAKAKELRADLILLYTHWGTEYVSVPSEQITALAHEFIDQGVDAIIGSHPHVIQTKEEYKGKTIYYSLGNFVFDQYFDAKNQNGLAVQLNIEGEHKLSFSEYKLFMEKNGQTWAIE